jgi:hypothetical protein
MLISAEYQIEMFPSGTAGPKVLCHVSNRPESILLAWASEALAVDHKHLPVLVPVPMDIGGDELQPGHTSIRIHVEDDTRWSIAKEILRVGLWK